LKEKRTSIKWHTNIAEKEYTSKATTEQIKEKELIKKKYLNKHENEIICTIYLDRQIKGKTETNRSNF
jgi:hypothetical protein